MDTDLGHFQSSSGAQSAAALTAMRRYIAHFAVRLWAKDRMHDGH